MCQATRSAVHREERYVQLTVVATFLGPERFQGAGEVGLAIPIPLPFLEFIGRHGEVRELARQRRSAAAISVTCTAACSRDASS